MEKRRFKLRNGSVVEEWRRGGTCERHGFIDDYKVLEFGAMDTEASQVIKEVGNNNWLCVSLSNGGEFPTGGGWGEGFDIVEELK